MHVFQEGHFRKAYVFAIQVSKTLVLHLKHRFLEGRLDQKKIRQEAIKCAKWSDFEYGHVPMLTF